MITKIKIFLAFILLLFIGINFNSCSPTEEAIPESNIFESEVPASFSYETLKTVNLDLTFSYSNFPMALERFELYADENGQDLLFTGVTNLNGKFQQEIIIPSDIENIFIRLSESDNGRISGLTGLKILPNLTYHFKKAVENLAILSIELDDQSGKCKWRVRNPLNSEIKIKYTLNLIGESGEYNAPQGDSFFFTGYQAFDNCEQCDEQNSENSIIANFTHNNKEYNLHKIFKCFCRENYKFMSWPSSHRTASLAFEDLWPEEGDYDMNDVVVDTKYKMKYKISGFNLKAKGLIVYYRLKYSGAAYKNGYAIQLPIASNLVESVSGTLKNKNVNLSYETSGVESGQSSATIIVFENSRDLISPYEHNPSEVKEISIIFKEGVKLFDLACKFPFNPFIFNSTNRTILENQYPSRVIEVHLPNKNPTDLADNSLFALGDEGGDPKYLTNPGRYPWALLIPMSFEYPTEKTNITVAYPYFSDWVLSGGMNHEDWFLYPDGMKVVKN